MLSSMNLGIQVGIKQIPLRDSEMYLSRQFLLISDNKDKGNERIFICEQQ